MASPHPTSLHFICLPTGRQTVNTLVQRCHAMLQVRQLGIDESRKIAADLCVAAAILLVEPQNIIPSRYPRVIPLPQRPPQQQLQQQQLQQPQSQAQQRQLQQQQSKQPQSNQPQSTPQLSEQQQPEQQHSEQQQAGQQQTKQSQSQQCPSQKRQSHFQPRQHQQQQQLQQRQQLLQLQRQQQLQIRLSQTRQVEEVQPLRHARSVPPPLNFSLYPSASPTAVRLSSTRTRTPLAPMTSPFATPTGSIPAFDIHNARSQHMLMLLQCFDFMIEENTRFRWFLITQRDRLGFFSPTAATPTRLRDAALRPFKNLSQFCANYFDHLCHESHAIHQTLLKRKLALEAFRNEVNSMRNRPKKDAPSIPGNAPSSSRHPQNDSHSFQQQVSQQTRRFFAFAEDSENTLKDQTNAVIMSFRVACAPAEREADAITKLRPESMSNFVKNIERNVQNSPGISTLPAPSFLRRTVDPIPDASSLAVAETQFRPFLTNADCATILQRGNINRRTSL